MSTHERTRNSGRILLLVLVVFIFRMALVIAVVPPWQGPDEPGHFEYIQVLASQVQFDPSERGSDLHIQQAIIGSMAEHGWWRHFSEPDPTPLPQDFSAVSHGVSSVTSSPPFYYLIAAGFLRVTTAIRLTLSSMNS